MQLTVTGKGIEVGGALRQHVEGSLGSILGKYFGSAIEAHAVFTRERHLIRSDLAIHIGRGIVVNSAASANEFYPAFDNAAERLAKQLRRYKRRLRDYHAKAPRAAGADAEMARSYVLAPPEEEDYDDQAPAGPEATAPVVIAEMSTELPSLTVGEAVMRMDLADAPVLLFRNRSHGALNLVYRRGDGNIGWIDPALDKASR
ncbi:MAG TPA: ribosome-associated translation inhibitor RaiA [Stellaceae bacterium]|nr:ribosome-associated translation inhibitor RaiA [Stellaceae bacterium]